MGVPFCGVLAAAAPFAAAVADTTDHLQLRSETFLNWRKQDSGRKKDDGDSAGPDRLIRSS